MFRDVVFVMKDKYKYKKNGQNKSAELGNYLMKVNKRRRRRRRRR